MKASLVKLFNNMIADLDKVSEYLKDGKVARAAKKIESMRSKAAKKVKTSDSAKPRKASGFALYVKANYKSMAAKNPSKTAPEIMKLVAALYRSSKEQGTASAKATKKPAAKATKKPAAKKASKKKTV
jgi:hypothetical protein